MKILYLHQYFTTPNAGGGIRSYMIAKKLLARNHSVVMITQSPNYKTPTVVDVEGIEVHYLPGNYDNKMNKLSKVRSFVSFMFAAIKEGRKVKDVDIVYATSTPLTIGFPAMVLRSLCRYPYIFEVRDLWPEFPIQIGAIRNPIIIKLLRWFEKTIYLRAEHIVALSPGMQEGVIKTGIASDKVTMIPNMSKPDVFYPRPVTDAEQIQWHLDPTKFHVVHFGAIAVANGLEYIIEAAKILKEKGNNTIDFIFLGKGAVQQKLEQMCATYGLSNVHFLGAFSTKETSAIVNCCQVSITTFRNLPILWTNSPNKLFDSLSAGKPCVVNSPGWTKQMVEEKECGFYVDNDDPGDLAEKLLYYMEHRDLLQQMGENARRLSIEVYDQDILTTQVAEVIEKAAHKA